MSQPARKCRGEMLVGALIIATTALFSAESLGQVDPYWLRSWNEAQAQRPESIGPDGRIAPQQEPGQAMLIRGEVVGPDGEPAGGVIVHAYHRDRDGYDFGAGDNALTTWRLQGWARTDTDGRFSFRTIRPAPDHLGREGAHVHFTLVSREYGRQWTPTLFFADDPLVTDEQRRRSDSAGEFGWVREVETVDGIQRVDVRFRLKEKADF